MDTTVELEPEAIEVEVVTDLAPDDLNRKTVPEARITEAAEEDEVGKYGKDVEARFKKLSASIHTERRAKEAAIREREEAIAFAKQQLGQKRVLQEQLSTGSEHFITQAKEQSGGAVELAKRKFQDAYESGDTRRIADAQEEIATASVRREQSNALRPLHFESDDVYSEPVAPRQTGPDDRALEWQAENKWFGVDEEGTSFALGLHSKLVKEGVDPNSDVYYERVNARMREKFPEHFDIPAGKLTARAKPSQVVASATRSTAPRRVVINATQAAIAKRLGITNEQYAAEVLRLEKANG